VKKIAWFVLITGFLGFWIFIISFQYSLRDFVHEDNGDSRYFRAIPFETTEIENYDQRFELAASVRTFFVEHPEYKVPSDLSKEFREITCGEESECDLVYFKNNPVEVYQLVFFENSSDTTSGDSYIGDIYVRRGDKFVLQNNNSLDSKEEERILLRLRTEILDKINWTFK